MYGSVGCLGGERKVFICWEWAVPSFIWNYFICYLCQLAGINKIYKENWAEGLNEK